MKRSAGMELICRNSQRGFFDHGWLKTCHTFSFAEFISPDFSRFRSLRVLNEDWIAPNTGFGLHPHHDMEIVTVVLSGQLQHRDSLGRDLRIVAGDVQRMTAGTGVVHSETNPSGCEAVHLYQLWFSPDQKGLQPEHEQKSFASRLSNNGLVLAVSNDKSDDVLFIHQKVRMYLGQLCAGHSLQHTAQSGWASWVQVAFGELNVNDVSLTKGDGVATEEIDLQLVAKSDTQFIVIELA